MRVAPLVRALQRAAATTAHRSAPLRPIARSIHAAAAGSALGGIDGANPFHVTSKQLQPGIPRSEFRQRREQLLENLPENTALIVHASTTKYMTNDIPYEFRQNSNFLYLTGLEEPDSLAVFLKTPQTSSFVLFVRPRDAHR
ncbi:hypothetical protein P43SY_011187 [Pythium insidiosum]|uniref:Aminopeptidase P N-terminal domain-containing protein n=1 Tax=Pythium insidiosum TaxID=114742 RepID=A0AAD5Q453_PYTIN|nr:hypothetical protein P43SY_011187 [Pythium insidiosum]